MRLDSVRDKTSAELLDTNSHAVATIGAGYLATLLEATTVTGNTATAGTAVTGLDHYSAATILLTIASKTFDAGTTLDIYVQYSPDEGTTWDDIGHFTQVTNAAMGNGTYVMFLRPGAASVADRATDDADGTLAANNVRSVTWCDRMRVKYDGDNLAGTDTITITVQGYFQAV